MFARRVTRVIWGAVLLAVNAVLVLGLTALPSSAHSQVVKPPAKDEPVVSGPISKPWAQAHCNAASPAIVAERSNGVVQFLPASALPCPPVPNPGGRIHGQ
jgi:hypothetical protein